MGLSVSFVQRHDAAAVRAPVAAADPLQEGTNRGWWLQKSDGVDITYVYADLERRRCNAYAKSFPLHGGFNTLSLARSQDADMQMHWPA
jgi:hypothetical protein